MKPHTRWFFGLPALLLAFSWLGCESPVPIRNSDQAIFEPDLVGRWHTLEEPGEQPDELIVLQFNDTEYYVELREDTDDPSDADTLRLRAFITPVEGKPFINVQFIESTDDDERLFSFYTYRLGPDGVLTLTQVQDIGDDKIKDFKTSDALFAFIRQHLNDAALYGESTTLMKTNATP